MTAAPAGLQLDLLSAVTRLRQVRAYLNRAADWDEDLIGDVLVRLMECDLPRLEGHLTADTRDWAAVHPVYLTQRDREIGMAPWNLRDGITQVTGL